MQYYGYEQNTNDRNHMSTAFDKYVVPNDDGSYTVYNHHGGVVFTTRDRALAAKAARRFDRLANS